MKKCPQCQAPTSPGEKFCGKCGASLAETKSSAKSSSSAAPASAPAASLADSSKKKKKTCLWVGLILVGLGVVAGLIIALVAGLYYKKLADIKNFYSQAHPDFVQVTEDLDKLDDNLNIDTAASETAAGSLEAVNAEIDVVNQMKNDAEKAQNNLASLKTPSEVGDLRQNLDQFYDDAISDADARVEILIYAREGLQIADRIERSTEQLDLENETDPQKIVNSFQQLKTNLDQAITDFEAITVPQAFQKVHQSDLKLLKDMSKALGDMTAAIQKGDLVSLNSSYNRLESAINEYDTKTDKENQEILDPEYEKLNNQLKSLRDQKNVIEDQFASLAGKYGL